MPLQLTIEYQDAIPKFLHETREQFEQEAKTAMAGKLFEMKRLSSGREKTILPCFLSGVEIKTVSIPPALNGATTRGVLWQASSGRFLLDVPEVARYMVEGGQRMVIDKSHRAEEAEVTRFLRMAPLAALLFQRGITVFHAAAAAGTQGAVLLAGDSGTGKSSLLAALLKRGWKMLSDDLAVVDLNEDNIPVVVPTFPELMLWPDAMEKLEIEEGGNGRHALCMDRQFAATPQPLKAIYCLSVHKDREIEVRKIEGIDRFSTLTTHLYNSHIADALLDRIAYMHRASVIIQCVPLRCLRRPRGQWSIEYLADVVEKEY